jgi:hypothetical protein
MLDASAQIPLIRLSHSLFRGRKFPDLSTMAMTPAIA